jgi:DNA repair and recombination RAD54-like protein
LLQSIRQTAPDEKVVIVSNFTSALSIIERLVLQKSDGGKALAASKGGDDDQDSNRCFTYLRLDGTTDQQNRQVIVDTFNRCSADRNFCLLLSAKAGGCGLNLIGANRLIMFDPDWNPATDIQAMGRVYRQGQTKPCTIYRLFTTGTVEEVMYQRQSQKGGLATLTVDGAAHGLATGKASHFSKEELADCFTLKENCACETKQKIGKHWPAYDHSNDPGSYLRDQGCKDEPLFQVATSCSNTLRFVHIVNEKYASSKATTPASDHDIPVIRSSHRLRSTDMLDDDNTSIASSSSEEEFEL